MILIPATAPSPTALSPTTLTTPTPASTPPRPSWSELTIASGGRAGWLAACWRRSSSPVWRRWSFRLRSPSGQRPVYDPFLTTTSSPLLSPHRQLRRLPLLRFLSLPLRRLFRRRPPFRRLPLFRCRPLFRRLPLFRCRRLFRRPLLPRRRWHPSQCQFR